MLEAAPDPVQLSRLRWRCRRGMRELDVLLTRYLEHRYVNASHGQQQAFEAVLELQDPTILAYLTGSQVSEHQAIRDVIQQLTRTDA
jgi:antitoxin CptB